MPINSSRLLKRFCHYVTINTQADEKAGSYPSSKGQIELGRILVGELQEIGLNDASQSKYGIVTATLPASPGAAGAPTIAWFAHLDTSPETSGKQVKPLVHSDYDGGDLVLPADPTKVIRPRDNPELADYVGKTIVTSDGTTLLGSDDKSGVAVIMEAVHCLIEDSEAKHGAIKVCFTCDEEIGKGVNHIDLDQLAAVGGYTLDGAGVGEIDTETFSADLAAVKIRGVNIHPAIARGRMINAVRIASDFVSRLPWQASSPETTSDHEGFLHPYLIEGGVADVTLQILLRDFQTANLAKKAALLEAIAEPLRVEFPQSTIEVEVVEQYRNMADGLHSNPKVVELAEQAMKLSGIEPKRTFVRGGTDGSQLTNLGLPTPNLSTGEHNIHSPLEWTCLEEMEKAAEVLIHLGALWAQPVPN